MSTETFLVTGGTGRIGTAFVHEIAKRGHTVRMCTRKPDGASAKLRARFGPGVVEPVEFPIDDEDKLARALDGVTGALFIPAGDFAVWHKAAAEAAKKAGVKHVVKVSVTGARAEAKPASIPGRHWIGEEAIREVGVDATMIRPTIFMQHFLGLSPVLFRPGDPSIHLPTGDAKVAFLDCRDIAACAAAILVDEAKRAAWKGKGFELTGPSAVTGPEIAEILSGVGEREIAWVDGEDKFSAHAAEIGVSDGIKGIYGEAAGGWFSKVDNDEFAEIAGRRTTSFAKFAYDHRHRFTAR